MIFLRIFKIYSILLLFYSTNECLISFKHNYSGSFSNLLLKNKYLYTAGVNYVFRLNSKNISRYDISYKERLINTTLLTKNKTQAKNFIKIINIREGIQDIIICGTNLGKPHLYDLKTFDLSNQLEYNGVYLCPGIVDLKNLGLISFDKNTKNKKHSINGIMYSAVWNNNDLDEKYGIFSRYGIYRKEIEVNRGFLRTLYNPYWLWEPNFIAILEDNSSVFVFFTEYSIEEFQTNNFENDSQHLLEKLNKLTINTSTSSRFVRYSRVARVSKNDGGLNIRNLREIWSTFRKLKIKCNCHQNILTENLELNHFYNKKMFDYLHDSTRYSVSFDNIILTKALRDKIILSIFYHTFPNLKGKNNEYSILCEFNMEDINNQFKKHSLNNVNFNISKDDLKEFKINENILDKNHNFSFTDYIDYMNKNIIIPEEYIGKCKLILPYKIKEFTNYFESETNQENIFLSGSYSDIIHVKRNKNGTYGITDIYSLVDYFYEFSLVHDLVKLNSFKNVNEILVNENELYLSTNNYIHQIDLNKLKNITCNKYVSCENCVKNTNCNWQKNNCIIISNISNIKVEKCIDFNRLSSAKTLTAKLNQTIVLKCEFNEREILWKKNNSFLELDDKNYVIGKSNELVIINLRIENAGIYSCISTNDYINLHVYNLTIEILNRSSCLKTFFEEIKENLNYLKNVTKKLNIINNFC